MSEESAVLDKVNRWSEEFLELLQVPFLEQDEHVCPKIIMEHLDKLQNILETQGPPVPYHEHWNYFETDHKTRWGGEIDGYNGEVAVAIYIVPPGVGVKTRSLAFRCDPSWAETVAEMLQKAARAARATYSALDKEK